MRLLHMGLWRRDLSHPVVSFCVFGSWLESKAHSRLFKENKSEKNSSMYKQEKFMKLLINLYQSIFTACFDYE